MGRTAYILLQKRLAIRKDKGLVMKSKISDTEVLGGTLWECPGDVSSDSSGKIRLASLEYDNTELKTDLVDVRRITNDESQLLLAITTCGDRLRIVRDTEWFHEGLRIHENHHVYVINVKGLPSDKVLGVVKYKGPLPSQKGILFGVELLAHRGKGTTDGTFRRERFFTCALDCGLFLPINKLRLCKDPKHAATDIQSGSSPVNLYFNDRPSKPNLEQGERVVWVSDNGPEFGTVKWIGILQDSAKQEYTIGVEFDHSIGTGTGKYKDRQLFKAKLNHASLVPAIGLIKASEFTNPHLTGAPPPYDDVIAPRRSTRVTQPSDVLKQHEPLWDQRSSNRLNIQSDPPQPRRGNIPSYHEHPSHAMVADLGYTRSTNFTDSFNARGVKYPPGHGRSTDKVGGHYTSPSVIEADGADYQRKARDPTTTSYNQAQTGTGTGADASVMSDLDIGSMVEVMGNPPRYGVIRWIGTLPESPSPPKLVAGIEMEEESNAATDGCFGQHRIFHCAPRKAFFCYLNKCRKDSRFTSSDKSEIPTFGSIESPDIPGDISPPSSITDVRIYCGQNKGIQGHHNSCYLDATLFSMFYFTMVFDILLFREQCPDDIEEYKIVQKVLKESIVNPLRKNNFVRADKVMIFREHLDNLGSVKGMTSQEKDPEEFLQTLLQNILKVDPFIRLSSGQESYLYQLFMEKDERLVMPTTQQLFELSFLQSDIKLAEIPSVLILQMPRFGKDYKMYTRIIPSLMLDITDVLSEAPRECAVCGALAMFECKDCYKHFGDSLSSIAFCEQCCKKSHTHKSRANHKPAPIRAADDYDDYIRFEKSEGREVSVEREYMELFAIVCIQTSHYVSFVKCGVGPDASWVFFDSMADRRGGENGFNIPEISNIGNPRDWFTEEQQKKILNTPNDRDLSLYLRRMLCDSYICFYQNKEVMMFK